MDTKSKNIKLNKWVKFAALVLATLLFFLSGNFASLFIKGFANFGIFANPESFTETYVFRDQMDSYIMSVWLEGQTKIYETFDEFLKSEDVKPYEEKYVGQAEKVEKAYELLDKSGIEVYVDAQNRFRYALTYNGIRYFFNCGGTLIEKDAFASYDYVAYEEETTFHAVVPDEIEIVIDNSGNEVLYHNPHAGGGAPEYIRNISDALETVHNVSGHKDYGETTKENLLKAIQDKRAVELEEVYYSNFCDYYSAGTSAVESINYAIFYKGDNQIYTNCGITADDTEEEIYKKLNASVWAEEYKNGEYKLVKGEKTELTGGFYATLHKWMFGNWDGSVFENVYTNTRNGTERAYFSFNEDYNGSDPFTNIRTSFESYGKGHSLTAYLVLTFVCLAIACAICIYLLCVAGKTADGIRINFFDKVPFEINWVLGVAVMALAACVAAFIVVYEMFPFGICEDNAEISELFFNAFNSVAKFSNVVEGVCVAAFFMIWTGLNASLIRNIRNKTFFRYSVVFFCLKPIKWILKMLLKWGKKIFGAVFGGLYKQGKKIADKTNYIFACDYSKGQGKKFKMLSIGGVALFMLATIIYYCIAGGTFSYGNEFLGFVMIFLGVVGDAAAVAFVVLLITSQHRIMAAVSDMRKGNLGQTIDKKFMPPFMSRFADDILLMQDGFQRAVDNAVKDQRMKAELITNVSHDLKTPLTSIVNYVDLLKKCEINDETAQRYVSILDEKSHKMKKLIEDLVEASKASSGAVEIRPVKLNLCEFAAQTVGEHEDELKKYGIDIVLRVPEKPVMVFADAQKTMRIAENLFSNIRKYALEGTRVYVDVSENTEIDAPDNVELASITFKNISKNPLDVSADELTRRFVRGDASRSGEGSGLGLSIAKDLCELQNGKLALSTDGDLFKATVKLPVIR